MSDAFQALWVEATANGQYKQSIVSRSLADLPDQDLLVDVHYSSLNYKDALSANGRPGVTKNYPHTPGIDAAGVVLEDRTGKFKAGTEVIICGYDLGMNTPGGLAQRIRVPTSWAVALPKGMSLKDSMIIGTAGFTAGLCVAKLLKMDAKPEDGSVLVTGATGGVGSFSVALLKHLGFTVVATTGKIDQSEWLAGLGAHQVIDRSTLAEASKRPMLSPQWAHAVDCVGGEVLGNVIKSLGYGGSVAACGLTAGTAFPATVLPFILRGVNLLGVDCVELPLAAKESHWQTMAERFKLPHLASLATEINLVQAPEYLTRILNGHAKGRYLVNLKA